MDVQRKRELVRQGINALSEASNIHADDPEWDTFRALACDAVIAGERVMAECDLRLCVAAMMPPPVVTDNTDGTYSHNFDFANGKTGC